MRLLSYPLYPLAWSQHLTKDENIAREQQQGSLVDPLDAVVSDAADPVTAVTPDGVLPASVYPAAYTSILALDNTPTTSTTATSSPVSAPPSATPSAAISIYRRDVCDQARGGEHCSSFAMEYNIAPGQSVNTCTQEADYTQNLLKDHAGDTSDYAIAVGPFTSHSLTGCKYAGTNDQVGALTCNGGAFAQACSLPASTKGVKCGLATDTPIVYAEW